MESTNVQYSGAIHFGSTSASPARRRAAVSAVGATSAVSLVTARGRSPHLSSGMPMTAHSMTSSDSMIRFSTWAE